MIVLSTYDLYIYISKIKNIKITLAYVLLIKKFYINTTDQNT